MGWNEGEKNLANRASAGLGTHMEDLVCTVGEIGDGGGGSCYSSPGYSSASSD